MGKKSTSKKPGSHSPLRMPVTFQYNVRMKTPQFTPMKKIPFCLVTIFMITGGFNLVAQSEKHVIHMNSMMQVSAEHKASYKLVLEKNEEQTYNGSIYDYMDKKIACGKYMKIGKSFQQDGHFVYYHPNGQLESEGEFVQGVKVGSWKRYDNQGNRKHDRYYPAESADLVRESMNLEKDDDKK